MQGSQWGLRCLTLAGCREMPSSPVWEPRPEQSVWGERMRRPRVQAEGEGPRGEGPWGGGKLARVAERCRCHGG